MDSQFFVYSGSRGGTVIDEMKYDSGELDTMLGGTYIPLYSYSQTFSGQNIDANTQAKYNMATASWENYSRTLYTYDVANNRTQQFEQNWNFTSSIWANSTKKAFTYTAANKIATQAVYTWNGAAWANYAINNYTYDSINNVIGSSYSNWNALSMAYEPNNRDTIEYDTSNNLASDIKQVFNIGTGTWVNVSKYIYANYIAPGCFQTFITQSWNGSVFVNTYKDTILYNSYNQPTYAIGQTWTPSGLWAFDSSCSATHYYYELYRMPLPFGIENINSTTNNLELYPNPTTDIININFNTNNLEQTHLCIVDMAGSTIAFIDEKSIKSGANSIQWSAVQLPAGVYLVHLNNGSGQEVKRFTVCK